MRRRWQTPRVIVEDMVERLPGIAVSLEAAGMDVRRFASAPPVPADAVREVEKVLKRAVPGSSGES